MKKFILFTSILSTSVLATTESPQFFIGVKGGHQWALDDNYKHSSPEGTIYGVYGGLQFTPSWSWDVGYQYHDELKAGVTSVDVNVIESALRYDWYLQDDLSLYGRLGAAYWDMEKTRYSSNESDATGFSPLGEVGINYNFNPNVRLSAGYQYIDSIGKSNTGKYDSHGLLIGLTYMFGGATQPALVETASTPIIEDISIKKAVTVKPSPQTQTFSPKTTSGLLGFDSIEPSHDFIEQLTGIISTLNSYPQSQAIVVGRTDSTGSVSYNQKLSERRAQAVANYMSEFGVNHEQINIIGKGELEPVESNANSEGRAKNRQVEVIIPSFKY
jgi:OOP family OmpA-OmpF porin